MLGIATDGFWHFERVRSTTEPHFELPQTTISEFIPTLLSAELLPTLASSDAEDPPNAPLPHELIPDISGSEELVPSISGSDDDQDCECD